MERTTKLNSVGESMENCRSAFSLVCEAIEVQNDLAGRPALVTKDDPETVDMTGEAESPAVLTPEAEKILARDSVHLGSFTGSIDQDTQFVDKNDGFVSSDYSRSGLLGQANLIALVKKLEDAGFKVGEDYGILSVGGAFGQYYYLWYNKDNTKIVNLIADVEKRTEDYPLVDEDLYSDMESVLTDLYWDNMTNAEKIGYYEDHGAEVNPEWEDEDFDGEIDRPDFFNDNGDITAKVHGSTLSDEELKNNSWLNIPKSYFV